MSALDQLKQLKKDIEEVRKDLPIIPQEIGKEAALYVYEDVNRIFEDGVKEYYAAYSPMYYGRTNSLLHAFQIDLDGSFIKWTVNAGLLPDSHRVGSSYIFQYMFEEGYHGGANTAGGMLWRTPPPGAGRRPYTAWGRPAAQTEAPSDIIERNISAYEHSNVIEGYLEAATDLVLGRYNLFTHY